VSALAQEFPDYLFQPVEPPRFAGTDRRPWIAYARLSKKDPTEGFGQHIKMDDQHAQIGAYIENVDPGAPVIYLRDNKSAFLPGVYREDYERGLAMIARGEVKGLVAIHSDRVTRQVGQSAALWNALEASGAQFHTTHTGWIQDPTMMQMETMIAERESRIKRERNRNHHRRLAAAGKNPGGRRPFGYEPGRVALRDGTTPVLDEQGQVVPGEFYPDEAGALVEIADRVLGGESLASCVRWLQGMDLPEEQRPRFHTARGGEWATSNLSAMLRNPMLAGVRTVGEKAAKRPVAKAAWPAVFSWEKHEELVRLLGAPERRTSTSTASKYLLANLAQCAACGAVLRGRPGRKKRGKVEPEKPGTRPFIQRSVYVCDTGRHVYRDTEPVDAAVSELVIARLERSDSAGALVDGTAKGREAALIKKRDALYARRDRYAAKAAAGTIDEDYADSVAAGIKEELAVLLPKIDAARDAGSRPLAVLDGMTGPTVARAAWQALTDSGQVGRQRAIIRLVLKGSPILLRGGQREWDPDALLDVPGLRAPR